LVKILTLQGLAKKRGNEKKALGLSGSELSHDTNLSLSRKRRKRVPSL